MGRLTAVISPPVSLWHVAPAAVGIVLSGGLVRLARRADATDRARALGDHESRLPRVARERLEAALVAADAPADAGAAVQLWLLAALAAGCVAGGLDLTAEVPREEYLVPIGKAVVKRPGTCTK